MVEGYRCTENFHISHLNLKAIWNWCFYTCSVADASAAKKIRNTICVFQSFPLYPTCKLHLDFPQGYAYFSVFLSRENFLELSLYPLYSPLSASSPFFPPISFCDCVFLLYYFTLFLNENSPFKLKYLFGNFFSHWRIKNQTRCLILQQSNQYFLSRLAPMLII